MEQLFHRNEKRSGRPRTGRSPIQILHLFKENFVETRRQAVDTMVYLTFQLLYTIKNISTGILTKENLV